MKPCVCCGDEVTSTNPEFDYCRACFHSGHHLDKKFSALIAELSLDAYWTHTGGGCFALEFLLNDGGSLLATADQDALPPDDENGPWWLLRYTGDEDDEGEVVACGLDRRGLIFEVERVKRYG